MKRKIINALLCLLLLTGLFPSTALASTDWPENISIQSDAGIIMDADSGSVLYGKNIHDTYAPASITKVLTALIVLEHCSLDETVTFSQNAVYNVEDNSSSAGYDTGDTASVKDCLYALLLKSANESANALAEHVSGTTEEFAELMNEKAAELGCQDSHFANPSGLNDDAHYVSAYDMALITRAAFKNDSFAKIAATTYYELPPNKKNPEGQGISPGNKMIKRSWPEQYRPDVIGGKTGYTSIALNTLVIGAQQDDTRLITVILHSTKTQYSDTDALLTFGFANFKSVRISDYDKTFSTIGDDLKIAGLPTSDEQVLTIAPDSRVILPVTADFSETTTTLDYDSAGMPAGAIASVNYLLGDRTVGRAYLTMTNAGSDSDSSVPQALLEVPPSALAPAPENGETSHLDSEVPLASQSARSAGRQDIEESGTQTAPDKTNSNPFHISLKVPSLFWKLLGIILLVGGLSTFTIYAFRRRRAQEEAALLERRRRRAERLKETGVSEAEFDLMMQRKRPSVPGRRVNMVIRQNKHTTIKKGWGTKSRGHQGITSRKRRKNP